MSGGEPSEPKPKGPDRVCAWCSANAEAGRTRCPRCGAHLAQREAIDGLTIAGVTEVDPALVGLETHRTIVTIPTSRGGTITAIGSLPEPTRQAAAPETLGEPSEAALRAVELLDQIGTVAGSGNASPEQAERR